MEKRNLIIVLGMHRSGTSAIARGMRVVGIELGERLVPAIKDNNSKGFWEDFDILGFNIEILNYLGRSWSLLAPVSATEIDVLRKNDFLTRAVELLYKKYNGAGNFGFKDPRVSILLPFWKKVFEHCQFNVKYILAIRHPLSVVQSLTKRDGFDPITGYALWLGHVVAGLADTVDDVRVLVDYDLLIANPDYELSRIAKQFELVVDQTELQQYKEDFLDEDLRHTRYNLNILEDDSNCPTLVHEIYKDLLEVATDKKSIKSDELKTKIFKWHEEIRRQIPLLALADKFSSQINTQSQAVVEMDVLVNKLNQALDERDGQINILNQALDERDGQINILNQALDERDGQINILNQALDERD
ncbi:MAG: hypothetical protein JZU50_06540, partial [Desulfobulbaceae bacterium]|nr:hypothetical protein [Desulfobulbaceae bacterium]